MDPQNNQPFDFSSHKSDTKGNNVANDEIVIKLGELEPLNDVNCKHEFRLDGDEIGDTRAWVCIKCHRGTYLPKQITKIT